MTAPVKIRIWLALLAAGLCFTAIIVQKAYTPGKELNQTAKTLEYNLHIKEGYVNEILLNAENFQQLKSLPGNSSNALKLIQDFTAGKNIWFITLNNNVLRFWSGIKVIPARPLSIKEGYSFIREPNGYYEAIKKTEGNFSAIFFIPVKVNYAFQNPYLQNKFASDLITDDNIQLANNKDKNVCPVNSANHIPLFLVKSKLGGINHWLFNLEFSLWLSALITLCVLVNSICYYLARKNELGLGVLLLTLFILVVRFVNLHYNWPQFTYKLTIFNPTLYYSDVVNRSLGDFCINILAICWFTFFLYRHRFRLLKKVPGKAVSYTLLSGFIIGSIMLSTVLLNLFNGLVLKSNINFDVNNVIDLSIFSLLGLSMVFFAFLIFYFLAEFFLTISNKLPISYQHQLLLFATGLILTTAVVTFYHGFTAFYILWGAVVIIRAHSYRYYNGKIGSGSFAVIIFICSLISSTTLIQSATVKEREIRKELLQKLEITDDAKADITFKKTEGSIITDPAIINSFKNDTHIIEYVKTRLQKLYFNGYLSRYDFSVYEFDDQDTPLSAGQQYDLSVFKDIVLYSSFKVSNYFYRETDSFGIRNYFAIMPVVDNNKKLGTMVITLTSKPLQSFVSFPDLLVDSHEITNENDGYSYAFYTDNKLINQNGTYAYDIENTSLKGVLKQNIFTTTKSNSREWFNYFVNDNHLLYKPSERNLIVVSREEKPVFTMITSITFFFVLVLVFSMIGLLTRWLWQRIRILTIESNRVVWGFKIERGFLLYKTRIQFSMIFAVVVTLIAVGIITYFSISTQYQSQQDKTIKDDLNRIAAAAQSGYVSGLTGTDEESKVKFNEFADKYLTDLTLFDINGVERLTTQPKIYEAGLLASRMNARAFVYLSVLKNSGFVNDETIGKLKYKAAYVPLRNPGNETIAYLQLPYFSNETDHKERMGSLLGIMINVYAIIFIAIGLFAVVIARQITAPLNFIQYSLSKTTYGKKNEPIKWDRNDEIGALVKEYNKMISELQTSAQKLAQSERESAWREMAKQVAHEIKNPLTPLKLGLQLLDKSWKEKDPKFDQKFERFSKSFVEQIESLSSIASEFSAFAKMPDTRLERVNIFDILVQVVTIFKEMDNIRILFKAPDAPFFINGDRDQLLRCFNNLLKNAIEATPSNRQGIIDINYLITSKSALITVKDNGNGIPENLREKIFEPNFTTKSSGTGLGLAFVKNSIENAGGKVWFETILGEGTTFYFSLPAA